METKLNMKSADSATVRRMSAALRCTPFMAAILVNRGVKTAAQARTFLHATLADISRPFAIKDMDIAVERISRALERSEKILIFGDYDADGITAAALLLEFFRYVDADVTCYIPHRIMEGYGLKPAQITDYAVKNGIDLIITVDCGASSNEAAGTCKKAGIDLIITDHHQLSGRTHPDAVAILNPARRDCPSGLTALAGVGVAFYLVIALRAHLRNKGFWGHTPEPNLRQYCDLVTIGTIADIVPLTGENRIFAKTGIAMLNDLCAPGIQAIIKAAGLKRRPLTAEDVAFTIAPRINAAGRIDHARTALELLTTRDLEQTTRAAGMLNKLNTKRRLIEEEISDEIHRFLTAEAAMQRQKNALVLSHSKWHQGVIGIAASKVARQFRVPVALIVINKEVSVGSARSIPGINLYEVLCECADLFEEFGGHAQAAGFNIRTENIDRFEKQFDYIVRQKADPEQLPLTHDIDYELTFNDISNQLLDELDMLQPFGEQHPEPLFLARNVIVASTFLINGKHRKMMFTETGAENGKTIEGIRFNVDPGRDTPKRYARIVFRLRRNTWNNRNRPQLIVEATDPA